MRKLILAAFIKCWSNSAFGADLPDARQLLIEAEAIRNPKVSYEGTIKVTDERLGKIDERTFRVRSKNSATTIVEYLSPASEVGIKVLMLGDDMWVSMPRAAKPMRLAPRQKLVGNAAYGDVASISYADAYDAKLKGEEKIDGRSVYVLTLTAKEGKAVTYDRIDYSIDKLTKRPEKAQYMTSSGKVLREGFFKGYQPVLGVERPLMLVLIDSLDRNLTTTIRFLDAKEKTFPDSLFQKNSLR